jgi:hypothetical protein
MSVSSPFTPEDLVAGIASVAGRLDILESGLSGAIGQVSRMAARAAPCVRRRRLPTGQELVPVIVPTLLLASLASPAWNRDCLFRDEASLSYILVAFQAIAILDWENQPGWLGGSAKIPGGCIARSQQLSLHSPENPRSRVTVDAAGLLGGMEGSQIHRLGAGRALDEGRFGLGMAGSAK